MNLNNDVLFTCSGYGIAAQALTAVVRAHDGRGPQTALTYNILRKLDISSPDELIGYLLLIDLLISNVETMGAVTPQIPGVFFFFFFYHYVKSVATENPYRAPTSCRDNPGHARNALSCERPERCHRVPRPCHANSVATRLCHVATRSPCQDPNSVAT